MDNLSIHKTIKALYSLFFLNMIFISNAAFAVENITFNSKISSVSSFLLQDFLKNQNGKFLNDFDVSSVDLNNDGIPEFVLRPKECAAGKLKCTYKILAESKEKIVFLSEITAFNLMLSGTFSHGIQDFLAFHNNNNDYEYERYVWSPAQAKYILDETH